MPTIRLVQCFGPNGNCSIQVMIGDVCVFMKEHDGPADLDRAWNIVNDLRATIHQKNQTVIP